MNESEKTITVTRQQLIDTTRIMSGLATSLMRLSVRGEMPHEIIEKLAADVFDGIIAVPFAPTQSAVNQAAGETPAINTNVRLFDLVRFMRSALHQAELITDEEYNWITAEAPMANDPKVKGSPSPRRLEDYDDLRSQLAKLSAEREKIQEERKTDNDERNQHIAALQQKVELMTKETNTLADRLKIVANDALVTQTALLNSTRQNEEMAKSLEDAREAKNRYKKAAMQLASENLKESEEAHVKLSAALAMVETMRGALDFLLIGYEGMGGSRKNNCAKAAIQALSQVPPTANQATPSP